MTRTFIVLCLLLPRLVFAQYTVTGRVLNRENASAVANANVFLNNATIGDKTAGDGTFKFQEVKPGTYHLIVSIVGYNAVEITISIIGDIKLPDIYLDRKILTLNEVRISSKEDPDREKNLDLFRQTFLGASELANQCKLINPEVLDFDYDKKSQILTAKSADLLVIDNYALGYRIKYLVTDFVYDQAGNRFRYGGPALFEELKGSRSQQEKWNKKRLEVYENSLQHFLRAAISNKLQDDGFTVFKLHNNPDRPADSLISKKIALFSILKDKQPYRDSLAIWIKRSRLPKISPNQIPVPVTGEDIIQTAGRHRVYTLGCDNDPLYVVYNDTKTVKFSALLKQLHDQQNNTATLINFNDPVAFMDERAVLANPESLFFDGVWANKRVANLLPDNYEPPETEPVDKVLFTRIDSLLKNYLSGHEIEKAYLHFDKPLYMAGDTIYFKAYVTNGVNQPSALSRVLNVELIDPGMHISQAIKLKLSEGMAAGDFALPDTLKAGYYRVRAYTSLMADAGGEYLFEKSIHLVGAEPGAIKQTKAMNALSGRNKTQTAGRKSASDKIDLQFFPEGGNLITGVQSKIAFKAIIANGLGINVKGIIADEQGQKICDFASQHLGMGTVSFIPQPGSIYKAYLNYPDSSKSAYELPKPDDSGFEFDVANSDPRLLTINVLAGGQNHQSKISIAGQSGGKICYFTSGRIVKGKYSVAIRKDLFPEGIVQFTLFVSGEPMNERLVFIRNQNQIKIGLSATDSVSRPRQKVEIDVAATIEDHKPVAGSFSVAVINTEHLPANEQNENTILSHLLLASDLRGYIEQPGYYFSADNDKVNADLDLLLLTQGYHRFEWKQLLTGKFSAANTQPERIQTVTGTIKTLNGKPVPKARISMSSVSKIFFSIDTTSDENGRFVFNGFPTDSMRYIIQAADKELRAKTAVTIDRKLPPVIKRNSFINDDDEPVHDTTLIAHAKLNQHFHQQQISQGIGKHAVLLKEVMIKDKGKQKYLGHSSNLNGPGNANHVITADQLPLGCPVLTDCITGYLGRIQFFNGTPYMGGLYGHMETAVFIDGVEATGPTVVNSNSPTKADLINMLSVSDVASIEIITDGSLSAMYGVRGGGGAILITTKRWDDMIPDTKNFKVNYAYYSPPVFYKARTFYSPKYDHEKGESSFSDLRTTIYWNPNLNTDKHGNASFEFFNADTKGTYLVIIEGIDNAGHIGRQTYQYKVD